MPIPRTRPRPALRERAVLPRGARGAIGRREGTPTLNTSSEPYIGTAASLLATTAKRCAGCDWRRIRDWRPLSTTFAGTDQGPWIFEFAAGCIIVFGLNPGRDGSKSGPNYVAHKPDQFVCV